MRRPGLCVALIVLIGLVGASCAKDTSAGAAAPPGATQAATSAPPVPFTCPSPDPSRSDQPAPTAPARLRVVTTVAPITSIVSQVAGDRAVVSGVIPEGSDSHTFEPKPSVARLIADADVVFVNGLGLEDTTRDLARSNLRAGAQLVELGPLTLSPDQYIYDFSFPRAGGKPNPHLWTDPPMARCYAVTVARVLAGADPANAAAYADNAARLAARIDELDRLMVAATLTVPAADRVLLTYHDAYAYFADHYGWKVVGAIQVSSFDDPTPKEVARLIDQIRTEKVPAIFGSEVFPSPVLAQLAHETGATYVDSLRDDDLPGEPGDHDHSYLGLMRADFVTMVASLGGDASALSAFDTGDVVADQASYPQ